MHAPQTKKPESTEEKFQGQVRMLSVAKSLHRAGRFDGLSKEAAHDMLRQESGWDLSTNTIRIIMRTAGIKLSTAPKDRTSGRTRETLLSHGIAFGLLIEAIEATTRLDADAAFQALESAKDVLGMNGPAE